MLKEGLIEQLSNSQEYFERSTSCLTEEHSGFRPNDELMTVAQQVAHVAATVDWFFDGAFSGNGFDMDFEAHVEEYMGVDSLTAARERLVSEYDKARAAIESRSEEELTALLPEGPVMGGAPVFAIVSGIYDHTAHHRGALTVYSRQLGLVPPLPYMDMPPE